MNTLKNKTKLYYTYYTEHVQIHFQT